MTLSSYTGAVDSTEDIERLGRIGSRPKWQC